MLNPRKNFLSKSQKIEMIRELSKPQEKVLLSKHLTGDFGTCKWKTVKSLINKGYVKNDNHGTVTKKGIDYCNAFHQSM